MENKNIIIVAVAIVAIVAILGFVFATGMLNQEKTDVQRTEFKTDYMEGAFVGNVTKESDEKYLHSYRDKENKITYNMSTVDNSTALMDIYYIQGVMNPEVRTYNGNDWNIYFTQAVQGNDTKSKDVMNIVICQSQGEKQGYLVTMIIDPDSKVNTSSFNILGQPYKEFVEPLLESITLKECSGVPAISEQFGLSDDQFAEQMELVQQYKAGNTSALQETAG